MRNTASKIQDHLEGVFNEKDVQVVSANINCGSNDQDVLSRPDFLLKTAEVREIWPIYSSVELKQSSIRLQN